MYADIIIDISVENLDRSYQYLIPGELEEKVTIGTPVNVSFGRGNRIISGYVIGISEKPKFDPARIKPIDSIREKSNAIEDRMISLACWIKEEFGSTFNEALKCVVPVKEKVREVVERRIKACVSEAELDRKLKEAVAKKHFARERFLRELISEKELDYSLCIKKLNVSAAFIRKLETDGIISIESKVAYRNPVTGYNRDNFVKNELNEEQRAVSTAIKRDIDAGFAKSCLIYGVTGSGKTEVYMDVIDHVIAKGKQVIMLIPEIALTYQTVKRFYMRFGNRISIMNSRLSKGERYDQYMRAKNGETDIVIGPRSALFTPFSNLGLIIIDEEHESSYKSESAPKYSAREVAMKRAADEHATLILGSATPSLEAFTAAREGKLELFRLEKRAQGAVMPQIYVADMREELKAKNRSVFSRKLHSLIEDRLNKKEQIMLFLNRRGYSGSVSCRECGHVIKCPHCDVSMTQHKNGRMVCHYCGYETDELRLCPKCGSKYISSFGIGTQKIVEKLNEAFPQAKVLRMDADSTREKGSMDDILSSFADGEADILVGTQMIVKGHDFPRVTLVGIILADLSLYSSDFRSAERTFQLLAQASGRAGRAELPGEVVIQTYNPEHYSIVAASRDDYESFYEEEIAFRNLMKYPPAGNLLSILLQSENEEAAQAASRRVQQFIADSNLLQNRAKLVGPAPASPYKANDVYRMLIYIKCNERKMLVDIKNEVFTYTETNPDRRVQVQFDMVT